jgi:hypothetical protein
MHDREDAGLAVVLDLDLARIPEQPPNGFAKPAGNHHGNERVDLTELKHRLERRIGRNGLHPNAVRRLDGADRFAGDPHDVLGLDAVLVR